MATDVSTGLAEPLLNESSLYGLAFDVNATAQNVSVLVGGGGEPPMRRPTQLSAAIRISLYSFIFLLSVVGNTLVIVTLIQNRRMRTVTNVFLLNLSISDLLLAVLCMPFTLVPTLLQDFIFGATMCVLIRYVQGECFQ